ncbi:hypothetical protein GCM10029963_30130 [Micromonospora andamanensis]
MAGFADAIGVRDSKDGQGTEPSFGATSWTLFDTRPCTDVTASGGCASCRSNDKKRTHSLRLTDRPPRRWALVDVVRPGLSRDQSRLRLRPFFLRVDLRNRVPTIALLELVEGSTGRWRQPPPAPRS